MPRLWLLVLVLAAGCTSAVIPSASIEAEGVPGGTLRVAIWVPDPNDADWQRLLLDPQFFFWHPLHRCCLQRTLLSYRGVSITEGGAVLQPDLAEALPEVSSDGLTWTFRLKQGIRYAPPFEDREIVARDFITALERTVRIGEYPYADVIDGVQAYRDEEADTISGVHAPNDATLVFRLTEPAGDFGNRAAMTFMGPIPAEALAQHDDDDGSYLVASGPYTLKGSGELNPADPAVPPTWEGEPLGQLTLVRNPSWSPETDSLRPAYAERIELVPVADREDALRAIEAGDFDVMLDPLLATTRGEAAADPEVRGRLREASLTNLFFIPLNLAQPPFDDPEVRRAFNVVIDRRSLAATFDPERGSAFAPVAHAFPDVAVAGLLREYAPHTAGDGSGDPRRARELMSRSSYDTDGDGRCDGARCAVIANRFGVTTDSALDIIEANLAELGITVTWVDEPFIDDPAAHVAFAAIMGWASEYPSANDFVGLMTGPGPPDAINYSLIGATPDQLASWDYDVESVPSLDDKISTCRGLSGSSAFTCWAELDQLLTEQVVAWVPVATSVGAWVISERVDRFEIAGSEAVPALDRISLSSEAAR